MKRVLISWALVLMGLTSCIAADGSEVEAATPEFIGVVLKGFVSDENGITFQVFSGGCTVKEDFKILKAESYPPRLTLIRNVQDTCEAHLPYGVQIFYSYAELGLQDSVFSLVNKIEPGAVYGYE